MRKDMMRIGGKLKGKGDRVKRIGDGRAFTFHSKADHPEYFYVEEMAVPVKASDFECGDVVVRTIHCRNGGKVEVMNNDIDIDTVARFFLGLPQIDKKKED